MGRGPRRGYLEAGEAETGWLRCLPHSHGKEPSPVTAQAWTYSLHSPSLVLRGVSHQVDIDTHHSRTPKNLQKAAHYYKPAEGCTLDLQRSALLLTPSAVMLPAGPHEAHTPGKCTTRSPHYYKSGTSTVPKKKNTKLSAYMSTMCPLPKKKKTRAQLFKDRTFS